jgi:NAD(P)-dependent dehydrogenase (short-subunit alcohol dehydrogenase family)
MQIHGSTFLITGAASGLGAACARRLASAGGNVVIADLNDDEGAALAEELGASARFIRTDVTNQADAQAAVDLSLREFGDLHGLAQCAGILGAARILGKDGPHDLALFERVVRVNLVGTFNMLRLAAVAMSAGAADRDGQRGVIVNTASVAAIEGQVGQAAYAASKGGVASLTLPAARELARFGIRVVAIAPGVFETAMMSGATDDLRQSLTDQIPFPSRWGQPSEFAQLVQSIIENPYINGTIIRLDGGLRMPIK